MRDLRIILQDNDLDIKGGVGFPLNYSVSDVKDPSKRNSSYSKTVTLVGSKNNNKVLGGLFDINSDFTFFNPNFKTECTIVLNSTTVMRGFFKLLSIDIISSSFVEGDSVEYKGVIMGEAIGFYTSISGKLLSDLNLSKYDHILSQENIVNSWNNTPKEGYYYPMLYKNSDEYQTKDFKPAIFEKTYLKRICNEAGYQLTGDLLDETTVEGAAFAKDVIQRAGSNVLIPVDEQERRKFYVDGQGQDLFSSTIDFNFNTPTLPWSGFPSFPMPLEYHDDTTAPFFDNSNTFDLIDHKWTADKSGDYTIEIDGKIALDLTASEDCTLEQYSYSGKPLEPHDVPRGTANTSLKVAVRVYVNNVWAGVNQGLSAEMSLPSSLSSSALPSIIADLNFVDNIRVVAGDEVDFRFHVEAHNQTSGLWYQYSRSPYTVSQVSHTPAYGTPSSVSVSLTATELSVKNGFKTGHLDDGDNVAMSSQVPVGVKQSDIITDIIKRYNAYVTISDIDRVVTIETRDGYYARGGSLDWTDLKDYSAKDEIVLLSELQNKQVHLKYSNSPSKHNVIYSEVVEGDLYGQKEVIYDNEFVTGIKKIESPFETSPLVYNDTSKSCVIPSIDSEHSKGKSKVLTVGGAINCLNGKSWNFNHVSGSLLVTTNYTTYPYAGHYDNPITPTTDINFGENAFEFYNDRTKLCSANLYNRFWKNYLDQINEGRKITMLFNLNEVVIGFIKDNLNTKIFVRDSWYIINKIIDYDASIEKTTRVELLKVKDAVTFTFNPKDFTAGTDYDAGGFTETGTTGVPITESDEYNVMGNTFDTTASLISLRNGGSLVKGGDYFSTDLGVSFKAIDAFTLDFNTTKSNKVVRDAFYTAEDTHKGVWKAGVTYTAGDTVVYGCKVWVYGSGTSAATDDFNLDSEVFTLTTDQSFYISILLRVIYDEDSNQIIEASDNRGNVVQSTDVNFLFNSDWNDYRISNNITAGFVNNDVTSIMNNTCNEIKLNYIDGSILNNVITGWIFNNNTDATFTMTINNNSNNGNIQSLTAVCDAFISANTTNGDIGTGSVTDVGDCESGDSGALDKSN